MIIAYNHNVSAIYRGFGRFARHDRRGPGALEDRQQSGLFWLLQTIAKLNTSAMAVVSASFGAVLIWRVWFRLCSPVWALLGGAALWLLLCDCWRTGRGCWSFGG